jgi:hypothetical protein
MLRAGAHFQTNCRLDPANARAAATIVIVVTASDIAIN